MGNPPNPSPSPTAGPSQPSQPRQEQQQEWHVVQPKNNRRPRKPRPVVLSSSATRTTGAPRSLQDITSEYHRLRQDPPTQQCCTTIRHLIRAHAGACSRVDKAICLGMGTFDPPDGAWEAKRRAYIQFLVFEAMVQEMETLFQTTIQCTFQEPLLTDADTAFLTARGHTVVPAPLASTAVTQHTLLYGIHLYRPLYEEALRDHLPSVFVGTGWETWDQLMLPGHHLHRIKDMHDTYQKWELPQDGTVFTGTWLYWRPSNPAPPGPAPGVPAGRPA
ncbi:hypothetical protein E4U42_006997 [Claviceps africana]|uniref:SRR1-like domain-containing protein n=1 Tax=Claviceps africana TaxID=83212 RepID=A0A8K0NGG5_9HYPO|nr:hypothetical protein E4U42_006997 [Claviceps africana]